VTTLALAHAAKTPSDEGLASLRRRLARSGASAAEAVLLDFLEDDLHEARDLIATLSEYVASAAERLCDPTAAKADVLALAMQGEAQDGVEELGRTLGSLRRRLALIANRLADGRQRGEARLGGEPPPSSPGRSLG